MKKKRFAAALLIVMLVCSFTGLHIPVAAATAAAEKGVAFYLPGEPVTLSPFTIYPENGTDIFFAGLRREDALSYTWAASEDDGASWQQMRTKADSVFIPAVTPEVAHTLFRLEIMDETGKSNRIDISLRNLFEEIDFAPLAPNTQHTLSATEEEADTGNIGRYYKIEAGENKSMCLFYDSSKTDITLRIYDHCLNEVDKLLMTSMHTGMTFFYLPEGGTYYLSISSEEKAACKAGDVLCNFRYTLEADGMEPWDYTIAEPVAFDHTTLLSFPAGRQYAFIPVELDFYDVLYFDISEPYIEIEESFLQQYPVVPVGERAFIAMSKGTYFIPVNVLYMNGAPFSITMHKLSPDFRKAGKILPGELSGSASEYIRNAAFIYEESEWKRVFEQYFYSYEYYQKHSDYSFTYQEYLSLKTAFQEAYRSIAKACKIDVPAGTALCYSEWREDTGASPKGEILYFLADQEGFLAAQQTEVSDHFAEEYLYPQHFVPKYYFRQNASMNKHILEFFSDPAAPVQLTVPCGDSKEFYYMPYGIRASAFAEGGGNYLDSMRVSFSLRPLYDAGQNQNLKSGYRAGEEITVSAADRILTHAAYVDDVAYALQCESVYAEGENGRKIIFRNNGDGTFTGRIPFAGSYSLKAEWKGRETCFGVATEEERLINNTITVRSQHCAELYLQEIASVEIAGFLHGDVNGDGEIDGRDAGLLLQYLAEWDVEIERSTADVSPDAAIDGRDAAMLLQYLAEWDVTLGRVK
ncbi:MAG: dockerin type I repeat-containing protein [Clostridia bacterium]